MRKLLLLPMILILCGCSVAGPFVRSISSDGDGGLIVEKGYVEYNYWLGVIGNKEATTTTIKIKTK